MNEGHGLFGHGRPRLPANRVRRHAIAIRTTKDLVDRLKRASETSGRSLAREIEYRLEQSFEVQELKDTVRPLANQLGELQKNFVIHTHKKIVVNVHNSTDRPIVLVIPGRHEQGRYERELVMNLAGGEAAAKLPTELDELERKPSEGKATDELGLNRSRK